MVERLKGGKVERQESDEVIDGDGETV